MRLHSMGWQTFGKLAENAYNNVPFGFSHGRAHDNTELLRILTPNMLRVGRSNSRALHGPIKLPANKKELLGHVEKLYAGWFRIFKDTVVPRLISQPKWFKVDRDLKETDIVYFQKRASDLGGEWTIGEVDQVVTGRDGLVRRAVIKYFNADENDPATGTYRPQFTDRAVRSLIKIWSLEEVSLFDDLADLEKYVSSCKIKDNPKIMSALSSNFVLLDSQVTTSYSQYLDDKKLFKVPCDLRPIRRQPVHNIMEEEYFQEMEFGEPDSDNLTAMIMSTDFMLQ